MGRHGQWDGGIPLCQMAAPMVRRAIGGMKVRPPAMRRRACARSRAGRRRHRLAGLRASLPCPDAMTDPRLSSLLQDCPDLRLKTDPADLQHYGRDWTRRWTPAPLAIALPATVAEVQA